MDALAGQFALSSTYMWTFSMIIHLKYFSSLSMLVGRQYCTNWEATWDNIWDKKSRPITRELGSRGILLLLGTTSGPIHHPAVNLDLAWLPFWWAACPEQGPWTVQGPPTWPSLIGPGWGGTPAPLHPRSRLRKVRIPCFRLGFVGLGELLYLVPILLHWTKCPEQSEGLWSAKDLAGFSFACPSDQ